MNQVDTGVFCQLSLEPNISAPRHLVFCSMQPEGAASWVRAAAEGQLGMMELGNYEHAAKLAANTDMNVYGYVSPILYPKSLSSLVQMLDYNCFLQKSELQHTRENKAINSSQGQSCFA